MKMEKGAESQCMQVGTRNGKGQGKRGGERFSVQRIKISGDPKTEEPKDGERV